MDMSRFSDDELELFHDLIGRIEDFLDMEEPTFIRAYDQDAEVFLPLSSGGSVASIHYTGDGIIIRSVVAGEVEYRTLNGEPAKMTADYIRARTVDTYQRAQERADDAYAIVQERGWNTKDNSDGNN
jgi:hypothetical protein